MFFTENISVIYFTVWRIFTFPIQLTQESVTISFFGHFYQLENKSLKSRGREWEENSMPGVFIKRVLLEVVLLYLFYLFIVFLVWVIGAFCFLTCFFSFLVFVIILLYSDLTLLTMSECSLQKNYKKFMVKVLFALNGLTFLLIVAKEFFLFVCIFILLKKFQKFIN